MAGHDSEITGHDAVTASYASVTALRIEPPQAGTLAAFLPEKRSAYAMPDYGCIHQELRRKGMTLMLLWEEYQADYADRQTYRYTQFCECYHVFAKQLKRSMRQVHRAGEKLFIDFAGPTVALTDGGRAHIFVAAMGASNYSFACATARETMCDWIESTVRWRECWMREPRRHGD
jgi:transposase